MAQTNLPESSRLICRLALCLVILGSLATAFGGGNPDTTGAMICLSIALAGLACSCRPIPGPP